MDDLILYVSGGMILLLKLIEVVTTKKDRRFSLGYKPGSMSVLGKILTLIIFVAWFFSLKAIMGL